MSDIKERLHVLAHSLPTGVGLSAAALAEIQRLERELAERTEHVHTPATALDPAGLWKRAEASIAERAAVMPSEDDAIAALQMAQQRLIELGWVHTRYAHDMKVNGVVSKILELGVSGQTEATFRSVNGRDVWWTGGEHWPAWPCLVKRIDTSSTPEVKP